MTIKSSSNPIFIFSDVIASAYTYETGTYYAHAVDAMGETATAIVERWEKKLTITEQPIGKLIPKGGTAGIRTAVADGEAPYSFQLYRNGREYVESTEDDATAEFSVFDPGEFYFHITDSQGHYADSDTVIFSNDILRIKSQTESEAIITPNGKAELFVEAEGGKKPYTYQWLTKWLGRWYRTGESSPTYQAGSIRDYACIVWDDDKQFAISNNIHVRNAIRVTCPNRCAITQSRDSDFAEIIIMNTAELLIL